ncbi:MAG: COG4280 domain-containing protein [Candidatus Dormibacteria bacterium]
MTGTLLIALAVFGACAVEMVEALTIVLASGLTRGWRSSLEGAAAAFLCLVVIVAVCGPALVHYVPINALRVVVGSLLLVLGMQWLRKAILRASGHKAKHDEDAIYRREVARLSGLPQPGSGRDPVGFTISFKGVLLEGMEAVMIVLTLGLSSGHLAVAAGAGVAAFLVVAAVGLLVSRQLREVPENAMKTVVGVMLVSFGTFWGGEGVGVHWPGSDLSLLGLIGGYALLTWFAVRALSRSGLPAPAGEAS